MVYLLLVIYGTGFGVMGAVMMTCALKNMPRNAAPAAWMRRCAVKDDKSIDPLGTYDRARQPDRHPGPYPVMVRQDMSPAHKRALANALGDSHSAGWVHQPGKLTSD